MTILNTMLEAAREMRVKAYVPYSKFLVGVCIKSKNGKLYSGCNIENASYGLTHCAEASAISLMIADGEREIAEVVVIGTGELICSPCGACRQRIREFAPLETPIHMFSESGKQKTMTLSELLPESFGPDHLI